MKQPKKKLVTFHLSTLNMWGIGEGKGRVSIYLPLKGLVDRGHEVVYITNRRKQAEGDYNGIKLIRLWTPLSYSIKGLQVIQSLLLFPIVTALFIVKSIRIASKIRPDVIYAHSTETALAARFLSLVYGSHYVLRLYGVGNRLTMSRLKKLIRLDFYIALKLRADAYIITDDGTKGDVVASHFGIPKDRIHFLKNGINKKALFEQPNKALKTELANPDENILLTVSRLEASKQVDLIIQMMPELLKLNPKVKLVIVGDGKKSDDLKSMAYNLKVNDNIVFAGAVEQGKVSDYMQVCDIFISMNNLSSMSNPVFEAMICAKSVIALNKGNTSELIKDKVNGLLIEEEEINDLAYSVNELLNDEEKRTAIGKNAQELINNNWPSWQERVDYETKLVESLISIN